MINCIAMPIQFVIANFILYFVMVIPPRTAYLFVLEEKKIRTLDAIQKFTVIVAFLPNAAFFFPSFRHISFYSRIFLDKCA